MRLHREPSRRRDGFTLIELLVVITIIAVLISLLVGAIMSAMQKVDEVSARNEVTTLTNAMKQFQADFKVEKGAPPSMLYLDETGQYNPPANFPGYAGLSAAQQADLLRLAADSKAYLISVWPRGPAATQGLQYDWNLSGVIDPPTVLEGEQCLVFFLAGAFINGVPSGFSNDPTAPMNTVGGRKTPYFAFVTTRLKPFGKNGYPVYYDAYSSNPPNTAVDKPYAYFSAGNKANGYNAYPALGSDCASLGITAGAYTQSNAPPFQFYKPETYQIISAGKNKTFGQGGYWVSSMGASGMTGLSAPATDEITNFYDAKLGVTP